MTTVEHYAEINPPPGAFDRTSREPAAFVPMAAVSEEGRLVEHELRPIAEVAKGYTCFQRGDVLMAKITPCMENGKAALLTDLVTERGFGSTEFHVLRPRPGVDARFLFYLVWNPRFRAKAAKQMTGSAGQKRVPAAFLKQAKVPLVQSGDQHRIADILDKADAIRRKRKQAIALTEELLRSAFLDMFGDPVTNPKGWSVVPLECAFAEDPRIGTLVPAGDDEGMLVVRVGELGGYDVALGRCKRATLSGAERERFSLVPGDVVLARAIGSEDHLGKASVLQACDEPVAFDSHVMRLRLRRDRLDPYFFAVWLRSRGGRQRFMREAGRTAVQFNVNGKQIARVQIPLPPIEEQNRFRALFDQMGAFVRKETQSLVASDDLFGSLVSEAFPGCPGKVVAPC